MRIRDTAHFKEHGASPLAFWLCGIAGVLVDIDHPIAYYLLPEASGRFLHTPILVICCLVLCALGAYLTGLYFRLVLTNRKKMTLRPVEE